MEKIKIIIDILHSSFDVLWRVLVAIVIAVFIIAPETFKSHLIAAGVTKATLGPFQWEDGLEKTDLELKDVETDRQSLQKRLLETNNVVTQLLESDSANGAVKEHAREVLLKNEKVLDISTKVATGVRRVVSLNEPLVSAAQAVTGKESTNWGIVFGAVPTQEDAKTKIDKAKELGYNVRLYKRRNYFRRVAEFKSQATAEAALKNVRAQLRDDAYVVNIETWCALPTVILNVVECS